MRILDLSLFVILGINSAQASRPTCAQVFSAQTPGLSTAGRNLIGNLNANLRGGGRLYGDKLNWISFEVLESMSPLVEAYGRALHGMSPAERSQELQILKRTIDEAAETKELLHALSQPLNKPYSASQFELHRAFRYKFHKVLKNLPAEFRPSIARLTLDPRRHKLNQQARDLIRQLEKSFELAFPTSGHESFEKFEATLRASPDPDVQKALQIVDQGQLQISMHRPESGRFWIPKVGFQNQFVTGSSRGNLDHETRNSVEAELTGQKPEDYQRLDAELKPKYGTLRVVKEVGLVNDSLASAYGNDIYTFKTDLIADRTTLYIEDSLVAARYNSKPLLKYEGSFIPWNRRLLLVPFMTHHLADNRFGRPGVKEGVARLVPARNADHCGVYFEAQIFGRVDLDLVDSFQFKKIPPSGEFLQELKKRNIRIIDGRDGVGRSWVEGS